MEIVASINFEQYKAALIALRVHGGAHSIIGRHRYSALGISMLITISFLLAYAAHDNLENAALVFLGVVAVYGICWSLMWWNRSRYSKCLKKTYEVQEKQLCGQLMNITEEGISGKSADMTFSYQYQWSSFACFIDLPDSLLFLPNSVSFVRIPKASLTSEEIRQIMAWWAPYAQRS